MTDAKTNCCTVHKVGPGDEPWKVAIEELTDQTGDYRLIFKDQVCPLCHLRALEKYRRARLEAKIQARQSVHYRSDGEENARIVDAVIRAVKDVTGQDARDLVGKKFQRSACRSMPGGNVEYGILENILPNLVMEAVRLARKKGFEEGKGTTGHEA